MRLENGVLLPSPSSGTNTYYHQYLIVKTPEENFNFKLAAKLFQFLSGKSKNPNKKFLFRVIGQTPMFRSVQIGADEKFKTKLKPAIEPWLNLSVGIPF